MARPLAVLLRAQRQTANLGTGYLDAPALPLAPFEVKRWREAKHAAAASCKKDAARTRRPLAIAAVLDEASQEEAAKIGGMAWIVRTALDGLGGFFGPYEMTASTSEPRTIR
jgi:hypothetical protein